jgi:hypothetical protein
MTSTPSDPVAALAALHDAAIAQAAMAGFLAGHVKSDKSRAGAYSIHYLDHALVRALPAIDLLKAHATAETVFDRLRDGGGGDFPEEYADERVMTAAGPLESGNVPDETATGTVGRVLAAAVSLSRRSLSKAGGS